MQYEQLTTEEIIFIENIVGRMLKPINGKIAIKPIPTVYQTWTEPKDQMLFYSYHLSSNRGSYGGSIVLTHGTLQVCWRLAWEVWNQVDGNINGDLAKNLWPADNNYLPEMNRFLEDSV